MRLIDADNLKAHYAWWKGGTREMTMDEAKSDFDCIIDLQPTVEAEPKVRCKDCKWYSQFTSMTGKLLSEGRCEYHSNYFAEDDFCSRGERKNG